MSLFSRFFTFSCFLLPQPFAAQEFAPAGTLPKKSCLKTYRRFFAFWQVWHSGSMIDAKWNIENEESRTGRNGTGLKAKRFHLTAAEARQALILAIISVISTLFRGHHGGDNSCQVLPEAEPFAVAQAWPQRAQRGQPQPKPSRGNLSRRGAEAQRNINKKGSLCFSLRLRSAIARSGSVLRRFCQWNVWQGNGADEVAVLFPCQTFPCQFQGCLRK